MMHLKPEVIKLHLGLKNPIRILQLTDVHLSLADDIDGEDMKAHAAERRRTFVKEAIYPERDPVGFLQEGLEYSKTFDCTVITGDVIDFTSHANLVLSEELLAGYDYMFCAGNHEFCPKVGIPDSFERKEKTLASLQTRYKGNLIFESRIVGGVNIVAIDNSCYIWTPEQFEALKGEVAKGLPILLFCHSPLTYHHMQHNPSHHDLVPSEEVVAFTKKVTQYIIDEPMIKAVFSGHMHITGKEELGNKTGYILGGLFKGIVGEILVD